MPDLSVIVTIYNIEKYIDRCILSLIAQTSFNDIEIILVDDCSTDGCPSICDKYSDIYSNVLTIHHKENQGLSMARNSGIEIASGKYIVFVDGDDYLEPDAYEKLLNIAAISNSDCIVFNYVKDIDGNIVNIEKCVEEHEYSDAEVQNVALPDIIGTLPDKKSDYSIGFSPWTQMIKKEVIDNYHVRFTSERKLIYEDLIFALDLYPKLKSLVVTNYKFYHYCVNKTSLTNTVKTDRYNRVKQMYEYLKKTPYYNQILFKDNEMVLRFKRTMMCYVRLCIMQLSSNKKYKDHIRAIVNDSMCIELTSNYPIFRLPIKQAIFALCIKLKMYNAIYFITSRYIR